MVNKPRSAKMLVNFPVAVILRPYMSDGVIKIKLHRLLKIKIKT